MNFICNYENEYLNYSDFYLNKLVRVKRFNIFEKDVKEMKILFI